MNTRKLVDVWLWIIGCSFLAFSVSLIGDGTIITGISLAIASTLIIPYTFEKISEKTGRRPSTFLRFSLVLLVFAFSSLFYPASIISTSEKTLFYGRILLLVLVGICFYYIFRNGNLTPSNSYNRQERHLTREEIRERNLNRREIELKLHEKELEEKEKTIFEKEQKKKGLIKFVGEDEEEKWGTPEQVKKWKEIDIGLTSNFFDMDPFEFEKFIGKLFEKIGYRDVRVTRKTGDFGIDVVAKKGNSIYAIQVKRQKNPVGNEVVQNTLGSMSKYNATKAMVITNSRFTKQAIEQARSDKRIELWDREKLHLAVREYFL